MNQQDMIYVTYSIFIPLQQGLRLMDNTVEISSDGFCLHSITTRIKMTKDYILNKIGKKFGCIQDFGYFCRIKLLDILNIVSYVSYDKM